MEAILPALSGCAARDEKGHTPLIVAASRQYPVAVKRLIEAKADVNAID